MEVLREILDRFKDILGNTVWKAFIGQIIRYLIPNCLIILWTGKKRPFKALAAASDSSFSISMVMM
ncbi:TPA: hypothetical protein ACJ3F8_000147 [Neisseria meningitidis]